MKKVGEEWIKNQSKINQTWTKHRLKIDRNRGLEASWRHLGGVLGRLGSILGCLGRFRAVWEAAWGRLGGVLEPS